MHEAMLVILRSMIKDLQKVYPSINVTNTVLDKDDWFHIFRGQPLKYQGKYIRWLAIEWLEGKNGSPTARVAGILRNTAQDIAYTYLKGLSGTMTRSFSVVEVSSTVESEKWG